METFGDLARDFETEIYQEKIACRHEFQKVVDKFKDDSSEAAKN